MSKTCVIIGSGIVGLHIAACFQPLGYDVYVLDKEPFLGEHTSGRNSGVIHSGIYYASGSLKEKLCLEGNRLTYEWLQKLNVSHERCGKWVVPDDGQDGDMDAFFQKLLTLPIPTPIRYSKQQLASKEPALKPLEAIYVPSTGILDAADYIKKMALYVEKEGGEVLLHCNVTGVNNNILETSRGDIPFDLCINAAGLFADDIARWDNLSGYTIKPCRGDYYISNKKLVSCPVYSLPHVGAHGLGVHVTTTIDGHTLFGPNAFFIENKTDYAHRSIADEYYHSLHYYFPKLDSVQLSPAYSGNRPKLYRGGEQIKDFTILQNGSIVHLLGIESPGLTAAPAIAKEVIKFIAQ